MQDLEIHFCNQTHWILSEKIMGRKNAFMLVEGEIKMH